MFKNFYALLLSAVLAVGVLTGPASAQTVTVYATDMSRPVSLSFDASGALFSGQFNGDGIYRGPAGGGAGELFTTKPWDGSGAVVGPDNALYTVNINGDVIRYAPGSTKPDAAPYATGTSTSRYTNLAFDTAGRLYVIGSTDNNVYRIPVGGGAAAVFGTTPSAQGPFGIAIGSTGTVYISNESGRNVRTISSAGGASTVFGTGTSPLYGIAVSSAGEVYVTEYLNNAVRRFPAAGGASTLFATISDQPTAVTIRSNVLYVGAYNTPAVRQVSLPPEPTPVPTMSEWALILLGVSLAGGAALYIQRRRLIA
jgi:streptogramin lyase